MGLSDPTPGVGVGMDFVGRVVKHGGEDKRFQIGDIVCGGVPGSFPRQPWGGAFATHVLAPANFLCRVPEHLWPLDAVNMGTSLMTCSMALWGSQSALKLQGTPLRPGDTEDCKFVLVYGGSTASGTMAIQLLRLSGHKPIATCSPKNFDLVRSFESVETFDYSIPDIGNTIRKYAKGKLRHALDCVTDKASVGCCYDALGRPGGEYASLEHGPAEWKTRTVVNSSFVMAIEAYGVECSLGGPYYRPASEEKHQKAIELHKQYQQCLDMKLINPHPVEVVGHGLESIVDGLERLKTGAVSGRRLAVVIENENGAEDAALGDGALDT